MNGGNVASEVILSFDNNGGGSDVQGNNPAATVNKGRH
jgi:hypothetical protein